MSSRSDRSLRLAALVLAVGAGLAGCTDIYTDRRETVSLWADDAVQTNQIVQMLDPWPASSAKKNIAFNGDKMQTAVERYRTNKVIPPVNTTTSSFEATQAAQAAQSAASAQNAAAAPVK